MPTRSYSELIPSKDKEIEVLAALYDSHYWTVFAHYIEQKKEYYLKRLMHESAKDSHMIAKLQGQIELCDAILARPFQAKKNINKLEQGG